MQNEKGNGKPDAPEIIFMSYTISPLWVPAWDIKSAAEGEIKKQCLSKWRAQRGFGRWCKRGVSVICPPGKHQAGDSHAPGRPGRDMFRLFQLRNVDPVDISLVKSGRKFPVWSWGLQVFGGAQECGQEIFFSVWPFVEVESHSHLKFWRLFAAREKKKKKEAEVQVVFPGDQSVLEWSREEIAPELNTGYPFGSSHFNSISKSRTA